MSSSKHFNAFHRFIVPSALGLGLLAATTFACSDAADFDDDSDAGTSSSSGDPIIDNPPENTEDSGGGTTDSGHTPDAAAHTDAGHTDAGHADGGLPESGTSDSGTSDSGTTDSGSHDSGISDSGVKDTGTPDTGSPDTGAPDSGAPDSGGSGGYDGGLSPSTCIQRLDARYMLRTDGKLMLDDGKTPITDATTGLPVSNFTSAADGAYHGCGSTADGKALCWRLRLDKYSNLYGQLGNGTSGETGPLYRASEVLVSAGKSLTNVATMASGTAVDNQSGHADSSCALTKDGKAYCWGDVTSLVNGGTSLFSTYAQPITVDGATPLSGIVQLAYTSSYACAVTQSSGQSSIWCWGENSAYNLGQGDQNKRQYPTKVLGLVNPTQVAIGNSINSPGITCAIDQGNVKCWGLNNSNFGACGNDSFDSYCVNPVTVLGPTGLAFEGATKLVGGSSSNVSMCALRNNDTVWCWGADFARHAGNIGIPNVVGLGGARALTDDGVYHFIPTSGGQLKPFCGPL